MKDFIEKYEPSLKGKYEGKRKKEMKWDQETFFFGNENGISLD